MSQLNLYLLGSPQLELDGDSVHIPRRKAMALLAYLAVTGHSHGRDILAALLWPENDQSSARAALRRMLSVLKRTLGEGWLIADRETVRLNTDKNQTESITFWLDVAAFQGKLKVCEVHNHPPTVTCSDCLPFLEDAIELYCDDFMAGFSLKDCREYEEWQFFQAEELRRQLTNALIRLSSHYANVLEYEAAISHARRWMALDPLHEPAHRHLMALYTQSGQRAAALHQYKTCRQVLEEELGIEPSEETQNLYEQIRNSTLVAARDLRPTHYLPVQSTPFIGRETELAEIRAKLKGDDCRLLTLLGPGGSGKTRLAIEAAAALLDDYEHGVFFVNLGSVKLAELLPLTIAAALRFSFYERGSPEEQLLDYLRNKKLLIILDNFEHLLAGVGFVNEIMNAAPGVKILGTSRTSLMVTGEHIYPVMGMAYPEAPASLRTVSQQYSAVRLFESGAKRRQATFELTGENIPDVIRICSLVEGMPLAIVLATSWVTMLIPAEIADEIARDLAFLEADMGDLPRRQRSLRSVFNHSWRLLSESERTIMPVLSVFRGGFTREAAQKVAGASLDDLKGLIDHSMLHRTSSKRYEIHGLLRQYAAEKLEMVPAGEVDIRGKHSDYYCQALTSWERALQGPQQRAAQQEMVLEIDNIRAAWKWAVEKIRLRALLEGINGLCIFYDRNRQRLEGEAICQSLLERLDAKSASEQPKPGSQDEARTAQIDRLKLQARALAWSGLFNMSLGNVDRSYKLLQRCLSTLERGGLAEQDTHFEKAVVYLTLPFVMKNVRGIETKQLAEEAVQLFKSLEEPWWVGLALDSLVTIAYSINGVKEEGEIFLNYEEGLAVRRKLGDLRGMADSLEFGSYPTVNYFQFEKAEEMLYEALAISTELDDRLKVVGIYGTLGWQWVWQGRFDEARSLYRETLATYSDLEYTQSSAFRIHAHLGFPDLYLGEYEAARSLAQHAIELSRELKHHMADYWIALSIIILGSVALAEGSYDDAERWFHECLLVFQTYDHPEKIGTAFACLGYVARETNQISLAQGHVCQALRGVVKWKEIITMAHALPGIALLFADQGDGERAVELYALASTLGMVANSRWFDDIAGDEVAVIAEGLPAKVTEAARARGRDLDLWETAARLLVELEELGWAGADQ